MGSIEIDIQYFGITGGGAEEPGKPAFVEALERTSMVVKSHQRADALPEDTPEDCNSWIMVTLLNDTKDANVRYAAEELRRAIDTALNWDRIGPVHQWGRHLNLIAAVKGRTGEESFTRELDCTPPRGFSHVQTWLNGQLVQGFNPSGW